jgi:hypothetical protein
MRNSTKLSLALAVTAGIGASAVVAAPAREGGRTLSATLTGAAEVPGPGDPDGAGTATVIVNPGQRRICYEIEVRNIDPAAAAHIHEAPAGVAGPVKVGLEAPTDGSSSACVSVSRELALEILKNPADYYVNVHNPAYPGGAVRGQLAK